MRNIHDWLIFRGHVVFTSFRGTYKQACHYAVSEYGCGARAVMSK